MTGVGAAPCRPVYPDFVFNPFFSNAEGLIKNLLPTLGLCHVRDDCPVHVGDYLFCRPLEGQYFCPSR